MKDFLKLNNNNWQEIMFDMEGIRHTFYNKKDGYDNDNHVVSNELSGVSDISKSMNYNSVMHRKGDVYVSQIQAKFSQNVIAHADTGIDNIALYFIIQGNDAYSVNKRSKREMLLPSNSNNIFFMHEDFGEYALYNKNSLYETKGIHLPIPYFERLVNLYPDLFDNTFERYQKGESFYLNDRFLRSNYEVYNLLSQINNSHLMGSWNNAYVDAKVLELLCLMFQQEQCIPNKSCNMCCKTCQDRDKIREAAYIIENNIDKPLTIRELALKVGVNEKKLKCGFKEVFNNTVYGYLFDYKMKIAEHMLRNTQEPISEIALKCGFDYPSHFSTAFKRRFGVSPHKWRI